MHEAATSTTQDNVVKNSANLKTKPQAIPPITVNIPESIRGGLSRWINWRFEPAKPKKNGTAPKKLWDKIPYQSLYPERHAATTWSNSWTTYITAEHAYSRGGFDGVGLVLTDTNIVGIDLDGCRDPNTGVIEPWASDIIGRIDSYTEVSPSKSGIRILCYGSLPENCRYRKGPAEIYDKSSPRFVTITGDHVPGTPTDLQHRQEELLAVHAEYVGFDLVASTTTGDGHEAEQLDSNLPSPPSWVTADDVIDALRSASNSAKFDALFSGKTLAYDDDASRADEALVSLVKFYAGGNYPLLIEVIRRSNLVRDKWDERTDYLERTWRNVHMENVYKWPDHRPRDVEEEVANVVGSAPAELSIDPTPPLKKKVLRSWKETKAIAADQKEDWLVPWWCEFGSLTMLAGLPFAGKSCIVAEIVAAICNDSKWCDKDIAPAPVILCDLENKEKILVRRIERALDGNEGKADDLIFTVDKHNVTLPLTENGIRELLAELLEAVGSCGGKCVMVIDTFRSAFDADELDTVAMKTLLYPLRRFAHRYGIAMIVLHHNSRGKDEYAGSAAIAGTLDYLWTWRADKENNTGRLELTGTRMDTQPPLEFRFDAVTQRNIFIPPDDSGTASRDKLLIDNGAWLAKMPTNEASAVSRKHIATWMGYDNAKNHTLVARLDAVVAQRWVTATKGGKDNSWQYWLTVEGSLAVEEWQVRP